MRLYVSTPGRFARAVGYVVRATKSKGCAGRAIVELLLDHDLSKEPSLRVDLCKGAGGGNFDTSQWLGNVWLYATDHG